MTSSVNVTNPQFPADLVTFTEEILNTKLHFLRSEGKRLPISNLNSVTISTIKDFGTLRCKCITR